MPSATTRGPRGAVIVDTKDKPRSKKKSHKEARHVMMGMEEVGEQTHTCREEG
jgi:hypothetical protein